MEFSLDISATHKDGDNCGYMYLTLIYTEHTQNNGAVSKDIKIFIAHSKRIQGTLPVAGTVRVSHALITVLQYMHLWSHDTHPHGSQTNPRLGVACPL
jgi:hypothetical protein